MEPIEQATAAPAEKRRTAIRKDRRVLRCPCCDQKIEVEFEVGLVEAGDA